MCFFFLTTFYFYIIITKQFWLTSIFYMKLNDFNTFSFSFSFFPFFYLFIKNLDSEFYKRRHIILFIKKKKKEKKKSIEIIHWVEYTHQPILFGNDNIKVKLLKKKNTYGIKSGIYIIK